MTFAQRLNYAAFVALALLLVVAMTPVVIVQILLNKVAQLFARAIDGCTREAHAIRTRALVKDFLKAMHERP